LIGIAVALLLTLVTADFSPTTRNVMLIGAAFSFLLAVVAFFWRHLRNATAILKQLDRNDRYVIAVEGVQLKRTHFGPFTATNGSYGHLTWDGARTVANKLISLGVITVSNNGHYTWTRLGRRVLKLIPIEDAQLPH
jgi:hypothetical protein